MESSSKFSGYSELNKVVRRAVKESTQWELYGYDLCILASAFCLLPFGFSLLRYNGFWFASGLFVLGTVHVMFITKGAHSASHKALGPWKRWNTFWGIFFAEVCGGFTFFGATDTHVNIHHPHTNVIGLGDSSIWKAPSLDREMYLFIAPIFIPLIAPLFSIHMQWGKWKAVTTNLFFILLGFFGQFACYRILSGLSALWSLLCVFIVRGLHYCVYIHVNIFQHIGLSMYERERRPKRLALMATGVLNLSRNAFLDYSFGHSLINCHVEHHLFPNLSDNMCMKIKPIVKNFIKEKGLPYQEDSYWNRLKLFYHDYKRLMVDAPPITEFIGVQ